MATSAAAAKTCSLSVNIYDGTRRHLPAGIRPMVTIFNGFKKQFFRDFTASSAIFTVPFHDNAGDDYTVIAHAGGYRQAGFFPVRVSRLFVAEIDLMLLPADAGYNFAPARWDRLRKTHPPFAALFAAGASGPEAAKSRYTELLENNGAGLACLLNILTVLPGIHLASGSPLDYMVELIWEEIRPDRFFAWADARLAGLVRSAAQQGVFRQEAGSGIFHPGATDSYKQVQFGEANVQLTFHEEATRKIGETDCFKLECDVDYFRDTGAHALLEVLVNGITGSITDPMQVYALRWMAGRHAGVPEFEPPYTLA